MTQNEANKFKTALDNIKANPVEVVYPDGRVDHQFWVNKADVYALLDLATEELKVEATEDTPEAKLEHLVEKRIKENNF